VSRHSRATAFFGNCCDTVPKFCRMFCGLPSNAKRTTPKHYHAYPVSPKERIMISLKLGSILRIPSIFPIPIKENRQNMPIITAREFIDRLIPPNYVPTPSFYRRKQHTRTGTPLFAPLVFHAISCSPPVVDEPCQPADRLSAWVKFAWVEFAWVEFAWVECVHV